MADSPTPKDDPNKKTDTAKATASDSASDSKSKRADASPSNSSDAAKTTPKNAPKTAPKTATTSPSSTTKSSSVPGSGKASTASGASASSSSTAASAIASKPAKAKSGLGWTFKLVLVIVILAGGAFVTKDVWLQSVQPYLAAVPGLAPQSSATMSPSVETTAVSDLSDRLAALEAQVQSSATAPVGANPAQDQVMAALQAEKDRMQGELEEALTRIGDLENRLQEVRRLAQAVTQTPSGAEVDLSPMMDRIDSIEESSRRTSQELSALTDKVETGLAAPVVSGGDGRANALVLSVAQLRDAALSGQPFAAQLDAFRAFADGNADLTAAAARLADGASGGLPTADTLAEEFGNIAGNIVTISRTSDGNWISQTAGRLSTLISVRRTDGQSGDPVEDAVATIESHLAGSDVSSAVDVAMALSDGLSSEPKALLEGWLLDAQRRADAETTLDALSSAALAGIGG